MDNTPFLAIIGGSGLYDMEGITEKSTCLSLILLMVNPVHQ